MGTTSTYLICYDIPNDTKRYRVARCLEGYGDRIQYSVFEAVLDRPLFDELVAAVTALVDPEEDKVAFLPLCAACCGRRRWIGEGPPWQEEEVVFLA